MNYIISWSDREGKEHKTNATKGQFSYIMDYIVKDGHHVDKVEQVRGNPGKESD